VGGAEARGVTLGRWAPKLLPPPMRASAASYATIAVSARTTRASVLEIFMSSS
jgi:hypothetical protein